MSVQQSDSPLEPERYELEARAENRFEMNRRQFLKAFGGGVAVLCVSGGVAALAGSDTETGLDDGRIGAWLHIGEDGAVTVYTGKVEVGQNIRTSLSQAVAEELRVPIRSIEMVMGDTDLTPYDRGTFGSRTTPDMSPQLRRAAAAAREVLIGLAAERWGMERVGLKVEDGMVVDSARGRSFDFGMLTKGRKLVETIPDRVALRPPAHWDVAGSSVRKLGGSAFVTGRHTFVSDMRVADMLYGKVVRPPAFGATLASLDAREAEAMDGVVVHRSGDFVGVAGPDAETAMRAASTIRTEWNTTPQPSREELFDHLKSHRREARGWRGRSGHDAGDVRRGLDAAHRRITRTYTIDYIAHAPMEPRAAVAQWSDGRLTVWTGTQRPFGVRSELADVFGLREEDIRVIMPDTGSAYGGKHTGEAAIEAARLAKAAGKPIKLVWTREEEFTWAYFRPAGVIEMDSALDEDGSITTWVFENYNSGGSGIETPYDIPNQHIAFHPSESPLRQGSYRGLASTANHFARESHMDELADAASEDPLAFRVRHLTNERLRAVLEAATSAFGWESVVKAPGRGIGLAVGTEKGGFVAACAEVAVDPRSRDVQVTRVVEAFECGAIVNPDQLSNQIEGAIVQGIGGALFESIEFDNGTISNASFHRYRIPRFSDTPEIEVVLIDRKDLASAGAGETPLIAIAPAIGNAVFDATGIRLRSLPMAPNGVRPG